MWLHFRLSTRVGSGKNELPMRYQRLILLRFEKPLFLCFSNSREEFSNKLDYTAVKGFRQFAPQTASR